MGMYTEFVFKGEIRKTVDPVVMSVLSYLFNGNDRPDTLPDHPFFSCDRWSSIGSCSSFYHHPRSINSWYDVGYSDTIYIFSRSDLKNYDDEISLFVDWVKPHLDVLPGCCIGWSWYEECDEPTLLIK